MGLGWYVIQKYGSKGLVSELSVFWMGQTSKTSNKLSITSADTNNQPITHTKGVSNNRRFNLNQVGLVLINDKVCAKVFPQITPMVVHRLDFGNNYTL